MKAEFAQRIASGACQLGRCRQLLQSLCFVTLAFLLCSSLLGQGTEGAITGTVTTQDGAVLPNAQVIVTNG